MTLRLLWAVALSAACHGPPRAGTDATAADATVTDADLADAAATPLPDLIVDPARTRIDLAIERRVFGADACELHPDEACIDAPGERTLLRFSVETANVGTADLILGAPEDNPDFSYSDCHAHYHFEDFAEFRLLSGDGREVVAGHKQAFCLLDTDRYLDDPSVAESGRYVCADQGLQRGWSDVYDARLPCQFIDVTDTPAGEYVLEIRVNVGGAIAELDHANNVAHVPVTLGAPELFTPTEPCPADAAARVTRGVRRECGWQLEGTWDCLPGGVVRVGCAAACDLGACTGDAMLRVCDADRPDGNCSYPAALGSSGAACGSPCPRVDAIPCPDSGRLAVYSAPREVGEPHTCDVALQ